MQGRREYGREQGRQQGIMGKEENGAVENGADEDERAENDVTKVEEGQGRMGKKGSEKG